MTTDSAEFYSQVRRNRELILEGELVPGIYSGPGDPMFGLFRLTLDGVWLFSTPTLGSTWKRAHDQTGDNLRQLV